MKKQRHVGIELARIAAMFLIILMHIHTQGGIMENLEPLSLEYSIEWILLCITYCAVNCYALISGYVGIGASYRYGRIFFLWLEVLFYTVIITVVFGVVEPSSVGIMDFVKAFTPASSGQYWFFSAYFGLFFFIPVLNYVINKLDLKKLVGLVVILLFVYSVLPTIRHTDPFMVEKGYSTIWLIILYFIGGTLKKWNIIREFSSRKWCALFWGCVLISWFSKIIFENASFRLFGEVRGGGLLISYVSPVIIVQAVAMLGFFVNLTILHPRLCKSILLISQTVFPVFIIHEHPLIKHRFISDKFTWYADLQVPGMVCAVVLTATVFFLCCVVVDFIRIFLFKMFHVKEICDVFAKKLEEFLDKKINKLLCITSPQNDFLE